MGKGQGDGLGNGGQRYVVPRPKESLMHPLPALAPVAILGLITAYGYQRTGALAAPILIHALYNGAVIGYALLST